jgi:hypothetical protein
MSVIHCGSNYELKKQLKNGPGEINLLRDVIIPGGKSQGKNRSFRIINSMLNWHSETTLLTGRALDRSFFKAINEAGAEKC